MKKVFKILIFSLFAINTFAQQATEIDSKSVKLPRYADLSVINTIPSPQQGMMVYNIDTKTNWTYNGLAWVNSENLTLPFSGTTSNPLPVFSITNSGSGSAAKFNITNPTSSAAVIEAETSGDGFAGSFQGTNSIDATGFVKLKGFTQLGELSPKIKTVELNGYIGAGSVLFIPHNLDANKILSINVYASLETGLPPYLRIPPSFISLGNEYFYDYYFDDTKIYFIIPSTSTKVKNFYARVLISYKE